MDQDPCLVHAGESVQPRRFRSRPATDILSNDEIDAIALAVSSTLPTNYRFEIEKTVRRCRLTDVKRVALQFPEGLLMFACSVGDLLMQFGHVEDVIILGDVTYGACCIDDYSAEALKATLLVHYGHSCLVPVSMTKIPCLYVFVNIEIDVAHVKDTISATFTPDKKLVVAGTIQFESAIDLISESMDNVHVPQCKPLSRGEVLGCTAPIVPEGSCDALVFIADGRFHLESFMMANPWLPAYRYDPYSKCMTIETYDHDQMMQNRSSVARKALNGKLWAIILGTLGRQGNIGILSRLEELLKARSIQYSIVLLSEIFPSKLDLMPDVDVWIQIACPRLSIDWGMAFTKPLLSPYEAMTVLNTMTSEYSASPHPMDFYSKKGGAWSNYYDRPDKVASSAAPGQVSNRERIDRVLRARRRAQRPHVPLNLSL